MVTQLVTKELVLVYPSFPHKFCCDLNESLIYFYKKFFTPPNECQTNGFQQKFKAESLKTHENMGTNNSSYSGMNLN